ncbi:hypothetical protein [Schleiferilactobacillus shenzhenensis]|uniref:hypothetical protein n=1 Tax=Schleiferilactobacillus shenzhenensis TaxID=1231337 RepID=UPI00058F5695|nr:hypothetical protein [Schleiferilactobacillus shenzhenensis]
MASDTPRERWFHTAAFAGVLLLAPWLTAWQNAGFARWGALTLVSAAGLLNILYQDWLTPRHPKMNLAILWLVINTGLGVFAGFTSNWYMPILVVLAAILWIFGPRLAQRPVEQQLLPVIGYGLAPFLLSIVLYTTAEGGLFLPALAWPAVTLVVIAAVELMPGITRGPIRLTIVIGVAVVLFLIAVPWAHLPIMTLILPVLALVVAMMPQSKPWWAGVIVTLGSLVYCLLIR